MPTRKTTKSTPTKKKTAAKKTAVKSVGAPSSQNISETLSVRKIANGYIVTKDVYNKKTGNFSQTETFTKAKPKLEIKI